MELRTYLSFPQGVVAFLVLILSLLTASITSNWQTRSQLYQKKNNSQGYFCNFS